MTPKEIQVLSQACQMAGIDSSKISPNNPFEKSGGTASLLQAAVAQVDPAQAAKWRVAAGGGLSIAQLSELESGQQLSQQAQKDLWEHDAAFVVDYQQQQQSSETATFKQLKEQAAASRLRNKMRETSGNESKAREALARQEAADEARKEQQLASAEHSRQMNQRLEQQRQNAARMAGVFING
jgi:hypothetical protein